MPIFDQHPDPAGEDIIQEAGERGWTYEHRRERRLMKLTCPTGRHQIRLRYGPASWMYWDSQLEELRTICGGEC